LSEYLTYREDSTTFPPDQGPGILERYEEIFRSALDTLSLEKEALKRSILRVEISPGKGSTWMYKKKVQPFDEVLRRL
jgi:hypothetical protein